MLHFAQTERLPPYRQIVTKHAAHSEDYDCHCVLSLRRFQTRKLSPLSCHHANTSCHCTSSYRADCRPKGATTLTTQVSPRRLSAHKSACRSLPRRPPLHRRSAPTHDRHTGSHHVACRHTACRRPMAQIFTMRRLMKNHKNFGADKTFFWVPIFACFAWTLQLLRNKSLPT